MHELHLPLLLHSCIIVFSLVITIKTMIVKVCWIWEPSASCSFSLGMIGIRNNLHQLPSHLLDFLANIIDKLASPLNFFDFEAEAVWVLLDSSDTLD
jgi:hypothetical protein